MELIIFLHEHINKPFLIFLNSFTDNTIIGNIVYFFADAPIFILPIFLIGFWIYKRKDYEVKNKLLFIFYSIVLAVIISTIIQQFVDISRPEESLKGASKLILKHIPDASFPSDHASVGISFLVSLVLFGFTRFARILIPFFIIMLLSRIAGGLHWPFDILAGTIIGTISSIFIYKSKDLNIFKKINLFILKISSYFKL